jgi:predicted ATP-dependent endonuclease of OLD family
MVARELAPLEENPDYKAALKEVEQLQKPILEKLSGSIQKTLSQFLHEVKGVAITIPAIARFRAMHGACEIIVDDGTPTLLKYKGDGAQSLAALGIIRHASETGARGRHLVIAIEEPESHLHPNAIHELKRVIDELSDKHQVLITTHNPLFVDRVVLANNILVQNNRAKPATSINQVRNILGVRASDNLRHAEMVLLTEGEDDKLAVAALLSHYSPTLRDALTQNTLAIDTLGGGSNLAYKIGQVRESLCLCHALLDNDKAGRDAFEKARLQGLISDADVNFCMVRGWPESELEDLYNESVYKDLLFNKYRVSIDSPRFHSKKKWSDRIRDCFKHCGKPWDNRVESEVKTAIAQVVAAQPAEALNTHHGGSIDSLVQALEQRIKEKAKQEA